jgi:hypothetical protein
VGSIANNSSATVHPQQLKKTGMTNKKAREILKAWTDVGVKDSEQVHRRRFCEPSSYLPASLQYPSSLLLLSSSCFLAAQANASLLVWSSHGSG